MGRFQAVRTRPIHRFTRPREPVDSSSGPDCAEGLHVRLHRIELLADTTAVDLAFHHQTTVVAGLGRLEREALAVEVIGALRTGRAGLSADISTHAGRRLEIRRPLEGPPKVIDVDEFLDVTEEFRANGVVDPLGALGLTTSLRLTETDVVRAEDTSDRIQRLARLDQDRLWALAVSMAELDVLAAKAADDQAIDDQISPAAAEQIEQARAEVDMAQQRLEELSDQSIVGSACLVLVGLIVAVLTHPVIAVPFIVGALTMGHRSWKWHQEHERAIATEREVLQTVGLESYLDFQLRKVDALTDDTKQRRETLLIAEKRRHAHEAWVQMVGSDVSLDWAATHRPTITTTAHRRSLLNAESTASEDEAVSLALADRIREATMLAEPHLLLIDDIFSSQNDETVDRLLWLVDHHSQQLQFIVMSNDARVQRWAVERAVARQASTLRLSEATEAETIELDTHQTATADPTSANPNFADM